MSTNSTNTKTKPTARLAAVRDIVITVTVTLALLAAATAVADVSMVLLQTAHAKCVTSPNPRSVAACTGSLCSGSLYEIGLTFSCSGDSTTASCHVGYVGCASSGSGQHIIDVGKHNACSSPNGSTADIPGRPPVHAGNGCGGKD